jgi:large subunit ribosomal protein L18
VTILSKSSKSIETKQKPAEKAFETGKSLGEDLKSKKIAEVVFDRNRYRYHGQVKSLAEGIRQAGIKF